MNVDRNKIIGERVRFYRTTQNISLQDMAAALAKPITLQMLSKYETGGNRWAAEMVCSCAEVLKVDVKLLLGMEDSPLVPGDIAWDAEHYKWQLVLLGERARKIVFTIIDALSKMEGNY